MRLDRLLADSGYGTRNDVKKIIRKGSVLVNGASVYDPSFHVNANDKVEAEGKTVYLHDDTSSGFLYFICDKPDNMLTAMGDKRLPTVMDLIPVNYKTRNLSPVGRLDYHTTGLLVLTNDGERSHRLTSPSYDVPKTYRIEYEGAPLNEANIYEAANGMILKDTDEEIKLKPCRLVILPENTCEITLTEGKTHEIRRIISHWERTVKSLRRISIGPLSLPPDGNGSEGTVRQLSEDEIRSLRSAVEMDL